LIANAHCIWNRLSIGGRRRDRGSRFIAFVAMNITSLVVYVVLGLLFGLLVHLLVQSLTLWFLG
jgi:hypothetical protein